MQLPAGQQLDTNKRKNRKHWPGWPRLNAVALPPGVMVFAFLDDFVNKKVFSHPEQVQKPMPPSSCGNMHIPLNVRANSSG